ncbi:MAG: helix-turn-helix transcriptional regulator [Synergistaceae bacterium]|nr:helix-turn-helix transcriptional regulator [Synergistaceae bacterium]
MDKNMNKTQLREAAKMGTATLSRLSKNEHVSMEVVEKICIALSCQPGDMMEPILTGKRRVINEKAEVVS